MTIDASVYGNDFTDNNVEIYYYEEPTYTVTDKEETPASVENIVHVSATFKAGQDKLI